MKTNILTTAFALPDPELLARIDALAVTERESTAELVAHLAALELRPSLYAAQGYGSLFAYCTHALRLSEDAACRRIEVARTGRRFPVIFDALASGALSLTYVRMLSPYLTAENHEAVLTRARNCDRRDIERLVAELARRPDIPASVRKLPDRNTTVGRSRPPVAVSVAEPAASAVVSSSAEIAHEAPTGGNAGGEDWRPSAAPPAALTNERRAIVQAWAPRRYRVQFTIGQETHDKLRSIQALLRRRIPTGDPGAIFDLALDALSEKVEKARFGSARRSGPGRQDEAAYETRIRSRADKPSGGSRHIPNAVKRAVWRRDAGQCAFVAPTGQKCVERNFLEFHHIRPYALDGPSTVGNISLRCRRHNAHEAELVFGPRGGSSVGERHASYETRGPALT